MRYAKSVLPSVAIATLRRWGAPFLLCVTTFIVAFGAVAQGASLDPLRRLPPVEQRKVNFQLSMRQSPDAELLGNPPASDPDFFTPLSDSELSGPEYVDQPEIYQAGLIAIRFPESLLWEVPQANQREPQMYGKFTNLGGELTFETAIGAEFGIKRWSFAQNPNEGVQLDFFAVVFTRLTNNWTLMTSDFRVGVPLTYARGPWQAKLAYEHTSTHLGDEYIIATGNLGESHTHDEIVLGLARRYANDIRIYGQYAYSFGTSRTITAYRNRFDWGIEWSSPRSQKKSRPFMAFDMDLRSVQGYQVNTTLQAGWQWRTFPSGRSMRLAMEYYNGKSPYGQFFRQKEEWIGFSISYGW